MIAALRFEAVPSGQPLIDAIELLRELDAAGRRALPDTAPTAFVPGRWRAHVTGEDGRPDRRRWELCLLSELRTALRSGAVWVQGSRRYQPADRYLIAAAAWPARRDAARRMLGLPASADERLVLRDCEGLLRQRYDGRPGTCYLLRPDQHVCARWRRFDADDVRAAIRRATCN